LPAIRAAKARPSNIIASQLPYSIVIKDKDGQLVYSDLNFAITNYAGGFGFVLQASVSVVRLLADGSFSPSADYFFSVSG
jgi:hypothetical protein